MAVRRRQDVAKDDQLDYGALSIDLVACQVTVDGAPRDLTAKEFALLAFMAAKPRHAFTRDELLRSVWQAAADWQQPATVTEHIRRLRVNLEQDPIHPLILQTVRGVGYRFDPPGDLATHAWQALRVATTSTSSRPPSVRTISSSAMASSSA
jgi:DNA-binding response OmpR family regulator